MKNLILIITFLSILFVGCGSSKQPKADNNPKRPAKSPDTIVDKWSLSDNTTPKYNLSTEGKIDDFSTIVYPNHPRIFFRDSDKAHLLKNMSTPEWRVFKDNITSVFKPTMSFEDTTKELEIYKEYTMFPQMLIFYAYLTNEPYYKDVVKKWAVTVLAKESLSDDTSVRLRISRLAEVYDWFYHDLTKEEKKIIRDAIKKSVDQYMSMDQGKHPNYIQSHSRWGHGVVSKALLSIYGDFDENFTKEYANSMLSTIREYLRNYQNVERYIAKDGGWHLGWMYAYFYGNYTFNYLVWSSATTECMLDDWMGELTYWFIYGLKSDDTFPIMGDTSINDNGIDMGEFAALYQKKYQQDPFADWYLDRLKKSDYYYSDKNYFIRFLLSDSSKTDKADFSTLSLSRHFKNAGVVIARDNWDDNVTMLIFKSSPFYSAGHHHRDENSFTIDYKTPLAVDSGFYDRTDTPHYKEYYVRTIAHNAITVYNPNQQYYYHVHYNKKDPINEKELVNDGGQIYKESDPVTLEDIKTVDALGGITKYYYEDDYTYMQGDATKAYDPITVSLAKRDVVYIKNSGYKHPVTIVLDKIEATSGDFQKRYLLHMDSSQEPTVDGEITTVESQVYTKKEDKKIIESEKVTISNITLFPKDASIQVVGDKDKDSKDAYPYYEGMDIDTKPDVNSTKVKAWKEDPRLKTGNWRLEVAPITGNKYDQILNVIVVGDNSEDVDVKAELIESDSCLGVLLEDRAVIFSRSKEEKEQVFEYEIETEGMIKHTIISGFKEGVLVNIEKNGVLSKSVSVKKDGCIDFDISSEKGDTLRISKY